MPTPSSASSAPQQGYPSLTPASEANLPYPLHPSAAIVPASMYPGLGNYMGLEFNEQTIRDNMPEYLAGAQQQVRVRPPVSKYRDNNLIRLFFTLMRIMFKTKIKWFGSI